MARRGYQSSQARQKLRRRHEPHLVGILDPITDPAVVEHGKPLERERRASTVAEQAFARSGQTVGNADAGVEIELQVLGTEAVGGLRQRAGARRVWVVLGAAVFRTALELRNRLAEPVVVRRDESCLRRWPSRPPAVGKQGVERLVGVRANDSR